MSTDRQKALDDAMAKMEKKFGKGAVMTLGSKDVQQVETYSTGSLDLDNALGVGGFPKGRISEIYAQESVGKTTIALHAIADAQKKGGTALFIDAEHALDPLYAQSLGVDIDALYIAQPDDGETALEILENLVSSGTIDIVVIDSVAALVPRAELEGEMGDMQVGLQARLMSKALRKVTGYASKMDVSVIFINQLRSKIGGMGYGPQTTTSGGNALKYFASVRIEMARTGSDKDSKTNESINNHIKATVRKNKLAPPFKVALFDIYFGKGIEPAHDVVNMAEKLKIIKKAGAWYSYEGKQLGQGKEKTVDALLDDQEMFNEIRTKVINAIKPETVAENVDTAAEKVDTATGEILDGKA